MELIKKYFSQLDADQLAKFEAMLDIYSEWNEKINVVSRKDISNLYLHHVLHSLAIAKFIQFKNGAKVLDLGTGGGFPGIPLAILFPQVHFTLVDGIGKKIAVVHEVTSALDINNVTAKHIRAEEIKNEKFDFVVTRAVAGADKLLQWSRKLVSTRHLHLYPNGIIALKGGNIKEELALLPKGEYAEYVAVSDYFKEEYFIEKFILYIQA